MRWASSPRRSGSRFSLAAVVVHPPARAQPGQDPAVQHRPARGLPPVGQDHGRPGSSSSTGCTSWPPAWSWAWPPMSPSHVRTGAAPSTSSTAARGCAPTWPGSGTPTATRPSASPRSVRRRRRRRERHLGHGKQVQDLRPQPPGRTRPQCRPPRLGRTPRGQVVGQFQRAAAHRRGPPHSQILLTTNAGDSQSVVLNGLRESATSGRSPDIGYFSWSAEPGADPLDPAQHSGRPTRPGLQHQRAGHPRRLRHHAHRPVPHRVLVSAGRFDRRGDRPAGLARVRGPCRGRDGRPARPGLAPALTSA